MNGLAANLVHSSISGPGALKISPARRVRGDWPRALRCRPPLDLPRASRTIVTRVSDPRYGAPCDRRPVLWHRGALCDACLHVLPLSRVWYSQAARAPSCLLRVSQAFVKRIIVRILNLGLVLC